MSNQCKQCYSYAINHNHHGRDGSDPDLCDVCYWHTRHDRLQAELAELKATSAVPDGYVLVPRDVLCRWENELDQIVSAMHISDEMAALLGGEA